MIFAEECKTRTKQSKVLSHTTSHCRLIALQVITLSRKVSPSNVQSVGWYHTIIVGQDPCALFYDTALVLSVTPIAVYNRLPKAGDVVLRLNVNDNPNGL